MQLEKSCGDTRAAERCEEGSKITQFVLSSCEKRMHDERGTQKRVDREMGERIKTGEQSAENHGEAQENKMIKNERGSVMHSKAVYILYHLCPPFFSSLS